MLLTPSFMMDLESRLQLISARAYEARNRDLWWSKVAKPRESKSKREVLTWLVDSGALNVEAVAGSVEFENLVFATHEYEHVFNAKGLEIPEHQFADLDGNGVDVVRQWATKKAADFAYEPQKRLAAAILANPTGYDGLSFFNPAHPVSGRAGDTSMGVYSNEIASKPIHATGGGAVSIDVAMANLGDAIATATALKAPDGSPRALRPAGLLVPGALATRATQMLGAKFVGATGSSDVEAVISSWNLGMPIVANELGAGYSGGSDTTYYLVMEEAVNDDLGAFVWSIREPLAIKYPSLTDSFYQESGLLRYIAKGRNAIVPGHPYLLIKVKAGA